MSPPIGPELLTLLEATVSTATTESGYPPVEPDTDDAAAPDAGHRVGCRAGSGAQSRGRLRRTRGAEARALGGAAEPGKRRRWPWILALALVVRAAGRRGLCGVLQPIARGEGGDHHRRPRRPHRQGPGGRRRVRTGHRGPRRSRCVAASVESVPEVAAVEVARGWPDTLAIVVMPRVPVAVTSANGQFWLLDCTGRSRTSRCGAARRD